MKRDVKIITFGHHITTATITIGKDGMSVTNITPHDSADFIIRNFIADSINMDEWKHSMHVNVGNAQKRGSEERKKIRAILDEKIESRKQEIVRLNDAKQILGRWSYDFNHNRR